MYYELTKREKKIARACMDKAFAAEIREGLEDLKLFSKNGGMVNRKVTGLLMQLYIKL